MPALIIEIFRYVDDHQPGFVECTFIDALGIRHSFIEKVPIVSQESLCSTSQYPRSGAISCEVKEERQDPQGRATVQVSTARQWGVESTSGQSQFLVLASQLRP